jgi:hypothetical protein
MNADVLGNIAAFAGIDEQLSMGIAPQKLRRNTTLDDKLGSLYSSIRVSMHTMLYTGEHRPLRQYHIRLNDRLRVVVEPDGLPSSVTIQQRITYSYERIGAPPDECHFLGHACNNWDTRSYITLPVPLLYGISTVNARYMNGQWVVLYPFPLYLCAKDVATLQLLGYAVK